MLPVTTTSEEARVQFELGREAAFHWNVAQAHRHLDAAIADDPAFVLAYLHRAGTSRPENRKPYFDRARAHLGRVTRAERRLFDAFRDFLIDQDYERAVDTLRDLGAEFPDDHHLRGYLGLRFYLNLQRYDEAVEQFEHALQLRPRWPQAYNFLGHVALAKEDHATADQAFRRYLELAPNQPQAYCSLGDLCRSLGRHAEAAAYYEQVLERDPDFFGGWIRPGWMRDVMAWTYAEARRWDQAERALRENIRLHPALASAHDSLGRLYLQLGRREDAAAQFEAALELDPDSFASRENLERARGGSS